MCIIKSVSWVGNTIGQDRSLRMFREASGRRRAQPREYLSGNAAKSSNTDASLLTDTLKARTCDRAR